MKTTGDTPAYDELTGTWIRMHRLGHLQSLASWDQMANMPPKGNEARAAAMAEMAALLHRMGTDPLLREKLERAEQEPLDLSWMKQRGEWGMRAKQGKHGLSLADIQIGSYGNPDQHSTNMTGRPRGAAERSAVGGTLR